MIVIATKYQEFINVLNTLQKTDINLAYIYITKKNFHIFSSHMSIYTFKIELNDTLFDKYEWNDEELFSQIYIVDFCKFIERTNNNKCAKINVKYTSLDKIEEKNDEYYIVSEKQSDEINHDYANNKDISKNVIKFYKKNNQLCCRIHNCDERIEELYVFNNSCIHCHHNNIIKDLFAINNICVPHNDAIIELTNKDIANKFVQVCNDINDTNIASSSIRINCTRDKIILQNNTNQGYIFASENEKIIIDKISSDKIEYYFKIDLIAKTIKYISNEYDYIKIEINNVYTNILLKSNLYNIYFSIINSIFDKSCKYKNIIYAHDIRKKFDIFPNKKYRVYLPTYPREKNDCSRKYIYGITNMTICGSVYLKSLKITVGGIEFDNMEWIFFKKYITYR